MDEENAVITREWYDKIISGVDIRAVFRKNELDERLIRTMAAIILVMFQKYPLPMSVDDITEAVNAQPFNVMEDGAFNEYVRDVVQAKAN